MSQDIKVIYEKDVPMVISGMIPNRMSVRKYGHEIDAQMARKSTFYVKQAQKADESIPALDESSMISQTKIAN